MSYNNLDDAFTLEDLLGLEKTLLKVYFKSTLDYLVLFQVLIIDGHTNRQ